MPQRKQGFKIDFKGKEVLSAVQQAAKDGVDETMAACVNEAKPNTPVITGALQGSIRFDPAQVRRNAVEGEWGSFDIDYALKIELARNMLRNAADAKYPELSGNIAKRSALMDPVTAVVVFLKEDLEAKLQDPPDFLKEFANHIADRVDGGELPRDEVNKQPKEWVVVRASGGASIGPGARSYAPWVNTRMDIRCYGNTPFLSYQVYQAV